MAFWTHQKQAAPNGDSAESRRRNGQDAAPVPFRWMEGEDAAPAAAAAPGEAPSFQDLLLHRNGPAAAIDDAATAPAEGAKSTDTAAGAAAENSLPEPAAVTNSLSAMDAVDAEATQPGAAPEDAAASSPETDTEAGVPRRGIVLPPRRSAPAASPAATSPFVVASPFVVVSPFRAAADSAPSPASTAAAAPQSGPGGLFTQPTAGAEPPSSPLSSLAEAPAGASPAFELAPAASGNETPAVITSPAGAISGGSGGAEEAIPASPFTLHAGRPFAPLAGDASAPSPIAAAPAVEVAPGIPPLVSPEVSPFRAVDEAAAPAVSPAPAADVAPVVPPTADPAPVEAAAPVAAVPAPVPALGTSVAAAPANPAPAAAPSAPGGIRIQASAMSRHDRQQLAVRLLFGVNRSLDRQDLLNLCESLSGVACAVLPDFGLSSASAPADLASSALRIREHLRLLQEEIGGQAGEQQEFVSIDTQRGTLCFLETDGVRLIAQLRGGELPPGSRERLYLLVDAIAALGHQG